MTTRAREGRRERASRRQRMRIVLTFTAAVIVGGALGAGIDGWVHGWLYP